MGAFPVDLAAYPASFESVKKIPGIWQQLIDNLLLRYISNCTIAFKATGERMQIIL
jgi:hypothetical protein